LSEKVKEYLKKIGLYDETENLSLSEAFR